MTEYFRTLEPTGSVAVQRVMLVDDVVLDSIARTLGDTLAIGLVLWAILVLIITIGPAAHRE